MAAAAIGLYGKLPVKRDYIALNLPAGFLDAWEEWIHASVAASREQLGERWLDLFLALPIWRFWLGRDICGRTVTGAFMPSVDGVGRYFPLCLCATRSDGGDVAPPPATPMPEWFSKAEAALLTALDPGFEGEPLAILASLPDLPARGQLRGEDLLGALLEEELQLALAGESWFWTLGGDDVPASALRFVGLPDPYRFVGFLSAAAAAEAQPSGVGP